MTFLEPFPVVVIITLLSAAILAQEILVGVGLTL